MKKNLLVAAMLGIASAVLYFASMADYAFPGISAHLQSLWHGLDTAAAAPYPFMAIFAKMFGAGNVLGPVAGAVAVTVLFALTVVFVNARISGEEASAKRLRAAEKKAELSEQKLDMVMKELAALREEIQKMKQK